MKGLSAVRVERILCLSLVALCLVCAGALAATAPTVSITAPQEGLTIASRTVTIEAAFSVPEGSTIAMAELAIDGTTIDAHRIDPPQREGTVSFTWLARDYDDGKHKITVRAIDSEGQAAKAAISVVLKSSESVRASAVRITSPAEGEVVSGSTTVRVEVDDPALARYVIFLVDDVLKAISNVPPFTYAWDTTRYLNGVHVLKARAYSGGEWESVSPAVQVHVDNPSGLTAMRGPAMAVTAVAPEPSAPPARAGEAVMPPPVRAESPAPAYPVATAPAPALAVPGTAPFVSPSGELITPPSAAAVEIAALPTFAEQPPAAPSAPIGPAPVPAAVAPGVEAVPQPAVEAPSVAPAEFAAAPLAPGEAAASAARQPSASPLEIAMLPAPQLPEAPEPAAAPTAAPTPEPVPPAVATAAEVEVAPAPAAGAQVAPASEPVPAQIQIAMLPPRPVEVTPAPKVAAEPMPSQIAYTVRTSSPLERLAVQMGVPATELASANSLDPNSVVQAGRRLAVPSTPIAFNGKALALDAPAAIADGRAIVPFRAVVEEAGGQVSWDSTKRQASATAGGHQIAVTIGAEQAEVDGGVVAMGAAAQIRCDRTVVPLRFLGDALDLALQYEDGIIHIASAH
ncbi:MAG: stalk domain-containing protein [Armatimonadota bacterium]